MVQELKGLLADQARKVLRHGRSASPRNGATVTHCAWHTIKRQRVQESDDELCVCVPVPMYQKPSKRPIHTNYDDPPGRVDEGTSKDYGPIDGV